MGGKKHHLKPGTVISCITMIMALAWLTVSLPYVNDYNQTVKKSVDHSQQQDNTTNPLSNTTEEKNESSVSSASEEYLHDHNENEQHLMLIEKYFKCHPSDLYYEFHRELISPPPEA